MYVEILGMPTSLAISYIFPLATTLDITSTFFWTELWLKLETYTSHNLFWHLHIPLWEEDCQRKVDNNYDKELIYSQKIKTLVLY